MAGKISRYFGGGNTARGFHNLFESNFQGLRRLFILKGGPGTGKSSLMKEIGSEWSEQGLDIEYIHCSSDRDSIDAVIIPALKAGIVDGTAPHVYEPKAPGAVEEYVNLGKAWHSRQLAAQREPIERLNQQVTDAYQTAYRHFADALGIHDQWETIYFGQMDFEKANEWTKELLHDLFADKKQSGEAEVKHRFLGAATPTGAVDFVPNLTEGLAKRYFLKGRAGTGKSTILKKVAEAAEQRGYDTEVYHCGFDPYSLDMVIVRDLDFAIFDSTAPHEYHPERTGDEILDTYSVFVKPGTDERFAAEIAQLGAQYKAKMQQGISSLAEAKQYRDQLEEIYIAAMDFTIVDELRDGIRAELMALDAERSR